MELSDSAGWAQQQQQQLLPALYFTMQSQNQWNPTKKENQVQESMS